MTDVDFEQRLAALEAKVEAQRPLETAELMRARVLVFGFRVPYLLYFIAQIFLLPAAVAAVVLFFIL